MKIKPSVMAIVGGIAVAIGSVMSSGFTMPILSSGPGGLISGVGFWVGLIGIYLIGRIWVLVRVFAASFIIALALGTFSFNGMIGFGICIAFYGILTLIRQQKGVPAK